MGSVGAMQQGSKDRYGQFDVEDAEKLVPEGIEGRVPYRGPLHTTLHQIEGGIRSGMGYCGATTLPRQSRCAAITHTRTNTAFDLM